jgi:hypothetical protein
MKSSRFICETLYQTNLFVASVKRSVANKFLLCYVLCVKCGVHRWHSKIEKVEKEIWVTKMKV